MQKGEEELYKDRGMEQKDVWKLLCPQAPFLVLSIDYLIRQKHNMVVFFEVKE